MLEGKRLGENGGRTSPSPPPSFSCAADQGYYNIVYAENMGVTAVAAGGCWRIVNCHFYRTIAKDSAGGAIFAVDVDQGFLEICDTLLIQCTSTVSGGGITSIFHNTYVTRVCGIKCSAPSGGFFRRGSWGGRSRLEEVAICGCGATANEGGGAFFYGESTDYESSDTLLHVNFTSNRCSGRGADIHHVYPNGNVPTTTWNFVHTAGSAATSVFHCRGRGAADSGIGANDIVVRSASLPAGGGLVSLDGATLTFTRGWFQNVGGRGLADTTSPSASFRYVSCFIEAGIEYSYSRGLDSGNEVNYSGPWTEYDFWAPLCTLPACPAENGVFDYVHPEDARVAQAISSCYRVVNCVFRRTTARDGSGGAVYATGTGELSVVDTLFIECTVGAPDHDGGAIFTTALARMYLTRVCGVGCTGDWGGFLRRGVLVTTTGGPHGESSLEELAVYRCGTGGRRGGGFYFRSTQYSDNETPRCRQHHFLRGAGHTEARELLVEHVGYE
jgi:hypothetical protein